MRRTVSFVCDHASGGGLRAAPGGSQACAEHAADGPHTRSQRCAEGEPSGGREPGLVARGLPAESARMRRRLVLTGASAAAGAPQRWPGPPAPPRGALDARPAREEQRRGVACMRSSGAAVARHRLGAGAPAAGPWAAALASERRRLGMSCPWRKERSEAAGLGFQTAARPFIRHQISSWPPDLDERSRFLRIRVSWDGPNGPNAQIGPRVQRRIFGPFYVF